MADTAHSGTSITGGHTNAVAGGAAGFMSGTDKTKLDGISASADVTATALPAALPTNNMRGVIEVFYSTTAALPACTYANGTLGVGATLTGNANGALAAQDGQTPAANDLILVKDQATGAQNGPYVVTTLGDGSNPFVLTRIGAADNAAKLAGCNVSVMLGTANANTAWTINLAAASITVGTTALSFVNPHTSATVPAALGTAAAGTSPHLARRDHVHTLPSVDGLASTAGALNMNSHLINNVTDPSSAQDAATKNYVDGRIRGCWGPWGNIQNPANTTQRFLNLGVISTTTPPTTETDSQMVAGFACTIVQIYVNTVGAALATDTQAMTGRVNGVNTAVTATVAAAGSTASLTGQSVAVAATDLISIGYVQSGTQAAANIKIRASLGVKI